MDNSLPAPNYTQIPNVIFDHWMAILKPNEFMVLMCLCRKTFGWHKTTDKISRNQLVKCTGLSKNTVKDALDSLEAHGLIIKFQSVGEYGNNPNKFHLNIQKPDDIQYVDEEDLPKSDQNSGAPRSNSDQGGRSIIDQGVGQILTTQKKDIQKKEKKKKKSASLISFDYEKNEFEGIEQSDIDEWTELYPGVNIQRQLKLMRQWLIDPQTPKRDGGRAFIRSWLENAYKKLPETPKKSKPQETSRDEDKDDIPYNEDIARIIRRRSEEEYVDYLKKINDPSYLHNYLKDKENNK